MQQNIREKLKDMTQEEILQLSEDIIEEIKRRNDRGFKYGQKVLITGKYAAHPSLKYEYQAPWGTAVIDNGYEEYVGTTAYIRDPFVHEPEEDGDIPYITLKRSTRLRARTLNVHPDDIVILGYAELEEYKPKSKE